MTGEAADPAPCRRAAAFIGLLERSAFPLHTRLAGVRSEDGRDIVSIVVEPEIPQRPVHDIRAEEPIDVHFATDNGMPLVFATRADFDRGLAHTFEFDGIGVWLCWSEAPWHELRSSLDPEALLLHIRRWLERTARDENHGEGQALEPLMAQTRTTLVVPPDFTSAAGSYSVRPLGERIHSLDRGAATGAGHVPLVIDVEPVTQGAFAKPPTNLADLATLLATTGTDTVGILRRLVDEAPNKQATALIVLRVPKKRFGSGPVTEVEVRALAPLSGGAILTVGGLGVALGTHQRHDGSYGKLIAPVAASLEEVSVAPWRVVHRVDRAAARKLAGHHGDGRKRVTAIGAGALGSNLIPIAARSGMALWTLIDDDVTLPHNTVRQAQGNEDVGRLKVESLATLVNKAFVDTSVDTTVCADVTAPGAEAEEVARELARADLVLDLTASPAATRTLGSDNACARAAAMFFSPDGADLVALAEDGGRSLRLHDVEAQYFWQVATRPELAGHLTTGRADFVRYANVCQDISRPLPPWRVSALSAIAARRVEGLLASEAHEATVWRMNAEGAVARIPLHIAPVLRLEAAEGWTVTMSSDAVASMARLRAGALPAETGGIVVGLTDLHRRTTHILGALAAPAGSASSPTYFERGGGARAQMEALRQASAGVLDYLGEWHSHPAGAATSPSDDDELLHARMAAIVGPTGKPVMMAIAGDAGVWLRFSVEEGHSEHLLTGPIDRHGHRAKWSCRLSSGRRAAKRRSGPPAPTEPIGKT